MLRLLGLAIAAFCFTLPGSAQEPATAVAEGATGEPELRFEFAAGMIRGAAPADWFIGERNVGREVQLVIASHEPEKERLPSSYILVTVHARSGQLRCPALLRRRVEQLTGGHPDWVRGEGDVRWGPHTGCFARLVDSNSPATASVLGIVETPWGHVEWQVSAHDQEWVERWAARVPAEWELHAPRALPRPDSPQLADAAPLIGSWKSNRGRLRLFADGRIELVWDKARITEAGTTERVIAGQFRAAGDLLSVTWRDGSHRNYRWRLEGPWLLMTDHEGRVMQLRALYE